MTFDDLVSKLSIHPSSYRSDYVIHDKDGNRTDVLCRICSMVIAGFVDGPSEVSNGREVIRQTFKCLGSYKLVTLMLDNDSLVSCPICTRCAGSLRTVDWDDLYYSTVLALARQAVTQNMVDEFSEQYTTMLSERHVVRRTD